MFSQKVYRIEATTENIYENYGFWNKTNGLTDLRTTSILARRRKNLRGKLLTASVVLTNNDSVNHLTDYKNSNTDPTSKSNYVIINDLMTSLNASKSFMFAPTWGYLNATTKRWSGMLGHVIDHKAEIGGTSLYMTPDRVELIEYLLVITDTYAKFIFRAPPLSYVSNIYFLPFQTNVWLGAGLLFLLISILIYLFLKFENFTNKDSDENENPLLDVFLMAIAGICQMGTHVNMSCHSIESKYVSARIALFFFLVLVFFLYSAYTANIVSLLQSTTTSIKTMEDLLKSNMECGVEDIVYSRHYFPIETEPIRRALYEKKILGTKKEPTYYNMSYGIGRMREGLYAFHVETKSAYKLIEETFYEHEKCGLTEMKFLQFDAPFVGIQKHSPYKEIIKTK